MTNEKCTRNARQVCAYEEVKSKVIPPKCVAYWMLFNRCVVCGNITATDNQRKENRKNMNDAMNKYIRSTTPQGWNF